MKKSYRIPFLFTMAFAFSPLASKASDAFESGDLSAVFYSVTGSGAGTVFGSEYLVVNLGPASLYRENSSNGALVSAINPALASSNIATDLSALFGPTWANDGNVRMMVTTTIPQDAPAAVNGDPAKTIYSSIPRPSLNSGQVGVNTGTTFPTFTSSALRTQCSNDIGPFLYTGTNNAINLASGYTNTNPTVAPFGNAAGVRVPTTNSINLKNYVPPTTSTYFKVGTNPTATLGGGTLAGSAGVEAAVDVYRVLHTLTGADLTSPSSTGNAAVGVAQYIGCLTLDTAGNLKMQGVGVANGSYSTWASANSVTGGANGDSDHDGISNLVEYALALNPAASDGSAGTFVGGLLSFTKRAEAVTNGDVTYSIQESDDLGISDPWQTMTPTSNTSTVIAYALPTGSSKKFARLVLTTTP